jgi:hypothetical protein
VTTSLSAFGFYLGSYGEDVAATACRVCAKGKSQPSTGGKVSAIIL